MKGQPSFKYYFWGKLLTQFHSLVRRKIFTLIHGTSCVQTRFGVTRPGNTVHLRCKGCNQGKEIGLKCFTKNTLEFTRTLELLLRVYPQF